MPHIDLKTFIEKDHLRYFIQDSIGKKLLNDLQIIRIVKSEKPDFILCSKQGLSYGFEISTLDEKTTREKFFQAVDGVIKKLFIKISQNLDRRYFVNLICLEKNLDNVKFNSKELLNKLFEIIQKDDGQQTNEKLTYSLGGISVTGKHKTRKIETSNGVCFQMIYSINDKNFGGSPIFGISMHNPVDKIQEIITRKEKKALSYEVCSQHFLMIVVDPFITKGCFFTFDDKFFDHEFVSNFSKVFLLILGGKKNIEVSELKLRMEK